MVFINSKINNKRKKMGYIPNLQPRWCRYCDYFTYTEKEIRKNAAIDDCGRAKSLINQNCSLGCFPTRTFASCDMFELKEQ